MFYIYESKIMTHHQGTKGSEDYQISDIAGGGDSPGLAEDGLSTDCWDGDPVQQSNT